MAIDCEMSQKRTENKNDNFRDCVCVCGVCVCYENIRVCNLVKALSTLRDELLKQRRCRRVDLFIVSLK